MAVATVAVCLSFTGVGFAAGHYLITSTSQIKPSVLNQLRGAQGPQGPAGEKGQNGTNGANGAPGAVGPTGPTGSPGGGGGQIGPIGPTGNTGPTGNPGPAATTLSGSVAANGTILGGNGLTSVDEFSTGNYVLTFDANISDCVPVASISGDVGEINDYVTGSDTVYVGTSDSTGAQAAQRFTIGVLC